MSVDDELEHLQSIAAFATLERSKLKLLAFASALVEFQAGDILFRQGDVGDSVYVLMRGEAHVLIDRPDRQILVAEIGADDVIGETAALCNVPRTATVMATTDLQALVLPKDVFLRLVAEAPTVGLEFMRLMADRFTRTVDRLLTGI